MPGGKAAAFISLTRPPNGILMFIAVLAGAVLSDSKSIDLMRALLSLIAAYSLNGSSMGFNDYFDREVDRVNAPERPIPSGIVTPSEALAFSSMLGVVGLLASALISVGCLIVAAFSYLAALVYNASLKRSGLPGNMVVSLVVVAPFIFGAVMSDGYVSGRILAFAVPVFLLNTGREVIKGISDVEGDALRNVKSVARLLGLRKAAWMGAGLYLAAVGFSPVPYLLRYVSWPYIPLVAAADAGFIYSAYKILWRPEGEMALKVKRETLLWMLLALAAFISGGFL